MKGLLYWIDWKFNEFFHDFFMIFEVKFASCAIIKKRHSQFLSKKEIREILRISTRVQNPKIDLSQHN